MNLASKLFKGDRVIWIIFMFLCLISVIEVFSATSTLTYKANANHWGPIVRHASFLLGGFTIVLILHNIPTRFFSALVILLPVAAAMLVLTPFLGKDENEAHRWLVIFGVQFQPSEFGKLACIVFVAFMMSKRSRWTDHQIFKYILIGVSITCALILPENFSTACMLFGVCFLLMFIGQLPFWKLAKLAGGLVLFAVLFLALLYVTPKEMAEKYLPDRFTTWKARMDRFTQPEVFDFETSNAIPDDKYQEYHAKIAIARGGVIGQMPGHGQERDFLPQAYSDFIYAIIIEELGMVGGIFVLLLYIMLLVRGGMIARRCDRLFPKFLVLGCSLLIVVQALFNMAVAVGLFPVTGQPLPLLSRGGTSTLITCVYFGIILSVSRFGAGMGNEEDEEIIQEERQAEADEASSAGQPQALAPSGEELVIETNV